MSGKQNNDNSAQVQGLVNSIKESLRQREEISDSSPDFEISLNCQGDIPAGWFKAHTQQGVWLHREMVAHLRSAGIKVEGIRLYNQAR